MKESLEGKICPYCCDPLDTSTIRICPECEGMMHSTCWGLNDFRCCTMGCPNSVRSRHKSLPMVTSAQQLELDIRRHWVKNAVIAAARVSKGLAERAIFWISLPFIGLLPERWVCELLVTPDIDTALLAGKHLEIYILLALTIFFNQYLNPIGVIMLALSTIVALRALFSQTPLIFPALMEISHEMFWRIPGSAVKTVYAKLDDEYESYVKERIEEESSKKLLEDKSMADSGNMTDMEKRWSELSELDGTILSYLGEIKDDSTLEERERIQQKIRSALDKMCILKSRDVTD